MTRSVAAHGSLDLHRSSTMDGIDAGRWNELSGAASFYLSHAWLCHVERSSGADCTYLLVRDSGGTLLGALPTYRIDDEQNSHYRTDVLMDGRLSGRHLLAGSCRAYHNDLMLHPSLTDDEQDRVLGVLLDAARRRATELGCADVLFLYLTTDAMTRLRRIRPDTGPLLLSLDAVLPVAGDAMDDYFAMLEGRRASGVRKDIRVFANAGYTTAVEPLSACWFEAGPLVANVQNRYGEDETVQQCRASLHSQARALDPSSLAFTARRDGRLVAMALYYAWRDRLHGRLVGFDYEALDNAREYFSLYFYEPLRWAYRNNIRVLHLGMGSYAGKFRRGARPAALWALSLNPARAGDWRLWNTDQLTAWRDEWGVDNLALPTD